MEDRKLWKQHREKIILFALVYLKMKANAENINKHCLLWYYNLCIFGQSNHFNDWKLCLIWKCFGILKYSIVVIKCIIFFRLIKPFVFSMSLFISNVCLLKITFLIYYGTRYVFFFFWTGKICDRKDYTNLFLIFNKLQEKYKKIKALW